MGAGDEPDDDKSKANDGPGEVSDKAAANDPQVRPLLEDGNYSKDLELTHKFDKVELGKVEVKSSFDLSKKETAVENLSALELDTCSNSAIHYLEDIVGTDPAEMRREEPPDKKKKDAKLNNEDNKHNDEHNFI